jgi:hypothetical protein
MIVEMCSKVPKIELPTSEEKAVADSRNVSLTKTQGPSVLLPPRIAQDRRGAGAPVLARW